MIKATIVAPAAPPPLPRRVPGIVARRQPLKGHCCSHGQPRGRRGCGRRSGRGDGGGRHCASVSMGLFRPAPWLSPAATRHCTPRPPPSVTAATMAAATTTGGRPLSDGKCAQRRRPRWAWGTAPQRARCRDITRQSGRWGESLTSNVRRHFRKCPTQQYNDRALMPTLSVVWEDFVHVRALIQAAKHT